MDILKKFPWLEGKEYRWVEHKELPMIHIVWFEEQKPVCFICDEPMDEGTEWWVHPECAAKVSPD